MRRMRPLVLSALACAWLAGLSSPAPAWATDGHPSAGAAQAAADADAQSQVEAVEAHRAYDRGTQAYRRKDYVTAAREYAAADALSPSPVALQAALDAATQADDPVLGETLLERARGTARTPGLLVTMSVAEQRFAHRTGRIAIACPAQPCLATIDGAATDPSAPAIVRVGSHTVLVTSAGTTTTRAVTVAPDETVRVGAASASAPTSALTPASTPSPGLSPLWLLAGVGATAVAGGLAIASGVDTANRSSAFAGCHSTLPPDNCAQRASDGQSAQTRTNVLLGVTAALGVASALALPFVRWHAGPSPSASSAAASLSATGTGVSFDARF